MWTSRGICNGVAAFANTEGTRALLSRVALLMLVGCAAACREAPGGHIGLTIVDAGSGQITPARVEILDESGRSHVAPEALKVAGDCGWLPVHNWIPWAAQWQMRWALRAAVANPFTGTSQFYLTRPTRMPLAPGRYTLRVFKGTEYKVLKREVEVRHGKSTDVTVALDRWIDLPAEGWYSADDHLHIPRPSRRFDALIARWMEAEDLHVGNLLQMGLSHSIHVTPQHGFGEPSIYQDGRTLIASGQENPRTHVLGHSITLGAPTWIDFPDGLKAALMHLKRSTNDEVLKRLPPNGAVGGGGGHTPPIYVTVAGTPPIAEQSRAQQAARAWLARLNELEARLSDDRIKTLVGFPGRGDGLKLEDLQTARAELLGAIARARTVYRERQQDVTAR
jgi:hypothetical protein